MAARKIENNQEEQYIKLMKDMKIIKELILKILDKGEKES